MLYDQIQRDLLSARKAKDKGRASILSTLLKDLMPSGNDTTIPDDSQVEKQIAAYQKSLKEMIEGKQSLGRDISQEIFEGEVLSEYMPKMISNEELHAKIKAIVADKGLDSPRGIGVIMGALSQKYPNQFDKTAASSFAKSLLV